MSSFCTTTPLFHNGCSSRAGGASGPSGQYVNVPFSPRYHQVMTCAIFTRCVGEQAGLAHDVLQPDRRVLVADAAERDRIQVGGQAAVVRAAEVEQHHRRPGVLGTPVVRGRGRGNGCCRSSPRAPGSRTTEFCAEEAAEVRGGHVVQGQVEALGDHAGRGGDEFLDSVEVVRRDRRPGPVRLDDVEHSLVLIIAVETVDHAGRSDRPENVGELLRRDGLGQSCLHAHESSTAPGQLGPER